MPLKLIPPRAGKTPNWSIRGTYLGCYVDKTCRTDKRSVAAKQLREVQDAIERGEFQVSKADVGQVEKTFAMAALAYMESGGERKHIARLVKYFGDTPVKDVDQDAVDEAARALKPNVSGATQERSIYMPVHAVLTHAGIEIKLRRPKGAKGRTITDFLVPQDAQAIIKAAESFDREYALLLTFLLYTGVRLGEALALRWEDVSLPEQSARIRITKNGDPRTLRLRDDLCEALKAHARTTNQERVFRFHQGGWLKVQLLRARLMACGVPMIARPKKGEKRRVPPHRLSFVNHHTFRHTWATWMRKYGGSDVQGLMATGNWRDPRSAARYAHAVAREEWQRVDNLPTIRGKSVESGK